MSIAERTQYLESALIEELLEAAIQLLGTELVQWNVSALFLVVGLVLKL